MDTLLLEDGSAFLLDDGRLLLESAADTGDAFGRVINICGHDRSVVALPAADASRAILAAVDRSVVSLPASFEESVCRH